VNGPAVHCDRLSVRPGRKCILDLPVLHVPSGQMVALLGPNGAGKSTFLRCLLGMQNHVRGRVSVLGEQVGDLGGAGLAAMRRRLGYVPQLLPQTSEMPLTVREVVAIGRTGLAGLLHPLRRTDWRAVDEWIDRLGLEPHAGRGFGEISGGEQRKALIARAMVQQPEMLLLDEPTANLDLGWRERMVEAIDDLYRSQRLTVILVCHELEVLPPCCDRVLLMRDGRLVADGVPESVLTTARIAELYGPGLEVSRGAGRWAILPGGAAHA
jgi:ABC-type cobalamin/Fe3+-siderophores transport system ATPase subunit